MSYSISDTFDKEASQFASDPDKDYFIEQAKLYYSQTTYGDKYNLIIALQAAHDMTIRDLQQGAGFQSSGNITSKTEAEQSISFGNVNYDPTSSKYLQLTRYGQKILYIKRTTILSMRVSGNNENVNNGCLPFCF